MDPLIRAVIDDCFLEGIIDEKIMKDKYKSRQGEMDSQTKSNINKAIEDFEKSVRGKDKFKRLRVKTSGWMLIVDGVDAGMRNTMVFGDPLTTAVGAGVTQGIGYVANRTKVTSAINKAFKKYGLMVKLHKSKLVNVNPTRVNPYYDQHYEFNIYRTKSMNKNEVAQFDAICDLFLDEDMKHGDFFVDESYRINKK